VCFEVEAVGGWWAFEVAMSLVFLCDLLLAFNTAIPKAGGAGWLTDRGIIAKQYLLGWFWIDAPSSVPVELVEYLQSANGGAATNGSALALLRFLRMFRLIRLLRLLKVEAQVARLEELLDINLRALRLISLLVKLLFTAHLLGCAWFYLAISSHNAGSPSWASEYSDGELLTASFGVRYRASVYFAFVTLTTVGYGDIVPVGDAERTFCTFCVLLGALLFAYIVGDIGSLLSTLDRQSALVEEKMDAVKEYLAWRGLPRDLSIRTKRYYEHYYTRRAVFDEQSILGGLNPQLHAEVVTCILRDTLGRLPLYAKLTPQFTFKLFPLLKPLSYQRHDYLYHRGDESLDLFFLIRGTVELSRHGMGNSRITTNSETRLSTDGTPVCTYPYMGCFGMGCLLGRRRQQDAIAYTAVEALLISKDDLEELLHHDATSARHICTLVLQDQLRNDKLNTLSLEMRYSFMDSDHPDRPALLIQLCWERYRDALSKKHDSTYQLVMQQANLVRKSTIRQTKEAKAPDSGYSA